MATQPILGTVINACFPRSGHRFLREILAQYFKEGFVFYEPYEQSVLSKDKNKRSINFVNYVKTHDFENLGKAELIDIFPDHRRYLAQYRHPLECITSYYEFSVEHGHIEQDTERNWQGFLQEKLAYWQLFATNWLLAPKEESLLVDYDKLYCDPFSCVERVIHFLVGNNSIIDKPLLASIIEKNSFLQYVGDSDSAKTSRRELASFKYYDAKQFIKIEKKLHRKFLEPCSVRLLLNSA